jgi:D-glycero-alpha-D-manno-heptose-7-phosphate kinase
MLIVKAPLRISIGGGGTDLPSYFEKFESTFISAAIDKYIYISLHKIFIEEIIIKYSELERVTDLDKIRHPIVREALKQVGIKRAIEISSFADIPSGTGLGSSGTFTVALLKALYTFVGQAHTTNSLAEDACRIEIEKLHAPIGKQDQYISAYGGLTRFHIAKTGAVTASPLRMQPHDLVDLQDHLLLFFTGYSRSANDILKEQDDAVRMTHEPSPEAKKLSTDMLDNLHFVKELGEQIGTALEKGDIDGFGRLMNVHWEHKKKRSKGMSTNKIDEWYELAMKNGALGGKLIGAGGGGFLMFLADDKRRLRKTMREAGMTDVPFRFDQLGAQVVLHE